CTNSIGKGHGAAIDFRPCPTPTPCFVRREGQRHANGWVPLPGSFQLVFRPSGNVRAKQDPHPTLHASAHGVAFV
ncbi:MAG: hypothetical protein ABMA15_19010, partial [Vicinamibacterales bacterium]